ncbi:hypothetical protein Adt_45638 [Abeliophyllum distichum]|uniref:Uncharacterized protein n=1 Tax=Abeliophyllum distichum TaxID=126358 RepID=A0ABD1PFR4_9LAMI
MDGNSLWRSRTWRNHLASDRSSHLYRWPLLPSFRLSTFQSALQASTFRHFSQNQQPAIEVTTQRNHFPQNRTAETEGVKACCLAADWACLQNATGDTTLAGTEVCRRRPE